MAKTYLTREDMRMRLNRCIVTWDGEPYYCDVDTPTENWYDVTLVPFEGLKGVKHVRADHRSERFSGASLPIGYFNYQDRCYYASRDNARKQQQGLHTNNLVVTPRCPNNYLLSNGFYRMLKNDYPSNSEAISSIRNKDVRSVAISRWFSYSWGDGHRISVYFQDRLVGYLGKDDAVQLLPDKAVSFVMKQAHKLGVLS